MATHSCIAALDDLSVIEITGEQRFDYLHGQITVSTKEFQPGIARLAAHCDFKGKMFSAMVVSQTSESLLLSMHKESAVESIVQLKKYGVFSKVDISESQTIEAFGIAGEENIDYLRILFPELNNTDKSTLENEFGHIICFNDTSIRYLCYLSGAGKTKLLELSGVDGFGASELWNKLEIEAGISNIQASTIGQFVPQMLNFQSLNAIDFDKGCYMGQEVVARTKFLGKNKRATYLLTGIAPNSTSVKAGDNIEIKMGENWRRGGVVLRSALCEEQSGHNLSLLAVMPNDTDMDSIVRLKDTETVLTLLPMPYAIET